MSKHLSDLEKTNIVQFYVDNKMSTIEISKILKRSTQCINNILKKENVKIRTRSLAQQNRNKSSKVPENFSLFPLTPLSVYFIGQVFGDGSIHKNGLSISVTSGDEDNLNNINVLFNNVCTISKTKSKAKVITLCKKSLVDELKNNFNLINDKADKLIFPYNIDIKLMPYFISGFLASDGMIRVRKRGNSKMLIIQFTSCSWQFLEEMSKFFSNILSVKHKYLYLKNKNKIGFGKRDCFDLTYYSSDAEIICKWIYENCSTQTKCIRKFNIFTSFYETSNHN